MEKQDHFMLGWQLAEPLAPKCKCGADFTRCGFDACVDLRGAEGWFEVDGVWQLWSDGRAFASINAHRQITLWPHLGLLPLKTRPRTIEAGKRHVLRWLGAKARTLGLVE